MINIYISVLKLLTEWVYRWLYSQKFSFYSNLEKSNKTKISNCKTTHIFPQIKKFMIRIPILMRTFFMLEFMRYSVSLVLYVMSVALTSWRHLILRQLIGGIYVADLTSLINEIARYKIKCIRIMFWFDFLLDVHISFFNFSCLHVHSLKHLDTTRERNGSVNGTAGKRKRNGR